MKNYLNKSKKMFYSYIGIFILTLFFGTYQCDAQSRTTLSQKEIDAIDTLFKLGYVGVRGDGWEINPDVWNMYNFTERKKFTEKLSVYYKNYTETGKQMSGFCYFYNMATKKKIARWYKTEYKEY